MKRTRAINGRLLLFTETLRSRISWRLVPVLRVALVSGRVSTTRLRSSVPKARRRRNWISTELPSLRAGLATPARKQDSNRSSQMRRRALSRSKAEPSCCSHPSRRRRIARGELLRADGEGDIGRRGRASAGCWSCRRSLRRQEGSPVTRRPLLRNGRLRTHAASQHPHIPTYTSAPTEPSGCTLQSWAIAQL
jgi:hypothetical protein